jgi:pimeloyl-ACP methyl ester carboxylesterase
MDAQPLRTGTIQSGDVTLFYRAFGVDKGKTPIIILHGSNYFDSYDWIGVGSALAQDRQVVAFDTRGSGRSTWSEYKDYSLDALFSDIVNLSAHFGWEKPAIMGHSVSGRLGIFFAAYFAEHLSQLIVVDTAMGKGNPGEYVLSVGNAPQVFKTIEEAMAFLARKDNPPRFSLDRERAELALMKVDGGFALTRDPDQKNTQSQAPGAQKPKFMDVDSWKALGEIRCPVTFIRGARSDRNKPEHYKRIASEYPQVRVETIDSRHDIAFEAPEELVAVVKRIVID